MNSNNLQNEAEKTEILTADEIKISKLAGSLERVSAPKDFEFRLKAKIAAGEQGNRHSALWQWLRYLLPAGAAAFVLAFVFYGTNFFAPTVSPDHLAENETNKPAEIKIEPSELPLNTAVAQTSNVAEENSDAAQEIPVNSSVARDTPRISEPEKQLTAEKASLQRRTPLPKSAADDDAVFSKDLGADPVNKESFPKGTDPNKLVPKSQENIESGEIDVEMLNVIGVETIAEGGKLKVKSIRQKSIAERSGVQTGDVIESFDEQKVNSNSNSSGLGERKLTISRYGKTMTIHLKSN